MKTCDKNLALDRKAPEELCGKPAAVESSLGKRHRCGEHHEGPGWREIVSGDVISAVLPELAPLL